MTGTTILTLSSINIGIALSGVAIALRISSNKREQYALIFIFFLFIGVSSLPVTIEFLQFAYAFHLTTLLPILLCVSPALYFYVLVKTSPQSNFDFHWIHKVLPITGIVITFGYWLLSKEAKNEMLLRGELPNGLIPHILALATFVLLLFWLIASISYLVVTVKQLRKYRNRLKRFYSNIDAIELHWIDWFTIFLTMLWFSAATSMATENFGFDFSFSISVLYILLAVLLLFLITFMSTPDMKGQKELSAGLEKTEESSDEFNSRKYASSSLSKEHAEVIAEKLETVMRDEQLFLDADLSLNKLSQHIDTLPNFVSQALNEILKATFYDYIGQWRVEAAKTLLQSTTLSITEIYLEVGFNTRSTFYKVFKQHTGITPRQYRINAKKHSQ